MNLERWTFFTEKPSVMHPNIQRRYVRRRFDHHNNSQSPGLKMGGVFFDSQHESSQPSFREREVQARSHEYDSLQKELAAKEQELHKLEHLHKKYQSFSPSPKSSYPRPQFRPPKGHFSIDHSRGNFVEDLKPAKYTKFTPKVHSHNPIVGEPFRELKSSMKMYGTMLFKPNN